jgi:hypothetical protein
MPPASPPPQKYVYLPEPQAPSYPWSQPQPVGPRQPQPSISAAPTTPTAPAAPTAPSPSVPPATAPARPGTPALAQTSEQAASPAHTVPGVLPLPQPAQGGAAQGLAQTDESPAAPGGTSPSAIHGGTLPQPGPVMQGGDSLAQASDSPAYPGASGQMGTLPLPPQASGGPGQYGETLLPSEAPVSPRITIEIPEPVYDAPPVVIPASPVLADAVTPGSAAPAPRITFTIPEPGIPSPQGGSYADSSYMYNAPSSSASSVPLELANVNPHYAPDTGVRADSWTIQLTTTTGPAPEGNLPLPTPPSSGGAGTAQSAQPAGGIQAEVSMPPEDISGSVLTPQVITPPSQKMPDAQLQAPGSLTPSVPSSPQ